MQRNQPPLGRNRNQGHEGRGRVGRIHPNMFHPLLYRVLGPGSMGMFVAPCSAPPLPKRPELTLKPLRDIEPGVPMTATKSSHPPVGMAAAPLVQKCMCGLIPCRYVLTNIEDPINPPVIDWAQVANGTIPIAQLPSVFVVTYAYDPPQVA